MSDERPVPWWYSGDESNSAESSSAESSSAGTGGGSDWLGLLSGAARMVDWAAAAVIEPHGDHRDPAEHPECLVCRTIALVQDRTGLMAPTPQAPVAAEPARSAAPVRWLEIRDLDPGHDEVRSAGDAST